MRESAIIGNDGKAMSVPGYTTDDWYPTTVPTTVLGALVRNGIYPDPYIGLNNMKIPDASYQFNERYDLNQYSHLPNKHNPWAKPYWLRREFAVPADYTGKIIWLNLDGINYRADVWVNGQRVTDAYKTVGMFKRFRLNITKVAEPGKTNALAIRIHAPDYCGDPLHAQIDGLKNAGPNGGDADILKNVTQYSTVGWDWVPAARDRNMGIWQHVSINASGPVVVADPAAFTDLARPHGTKAQVTVRFFLTNVTDEDQSILLRTRIQPDGFSGDKIYVTCAKTLEANSRKEVVLSPEDHPQLVWKNPRLWWPNTYGDQPLYTVDVSAYVDGRVSSSASSQFGVRDLESFTLASGGRAFKVNGKTIRMTGGAWISDFLLSWSAQRYRDEMRLMAAGNATFVRVNGCSIMPPDVFYEACDAQGLLVWQDFSRTSVSPHFRRDKLKSRRPPACNPDIYLDNMTDFVSRVRGRASVMLWCGSNEDAPQEDTGTALQNEILPRLDGTRIFLPSSSEQPSWSAIDINTYTGGPWNMIKLPRYYGLYAKQKGFESKNEIGVSSGPSINTLAACAPDFDTPDDAYFPFNRSLAYHDAAGMFQSVCKIVYKDVGQPSSLGEMIKWCDLYNNQVYRAIFEAANKARPRNEGTMIWKSNAAWPSFSHQIYDWNLRANAGYYTMKSACKRLHVQFSPDDAGVQVVSTLSEELPNVTVQAVVLSADGKKQAARQFKADIDIEKTVSVGSLRDLISDRDLYFIGLDLIDQEGRTRDRTVVWMQKDTQWQVLLSIPPIEVEAKVLGQRDVNGEIEYTVEISNPSDLPAVNIMAELTGGAFGEEILPAFWQDNALTLMPYETRVTTVSVRRNLITQTPFLLIEGLNVRPTAWDLSAGQKKSLDINIKDVNVTTEDEKVYLYFSARQPEQKGNRITTFPVKLTIDGELKRYVSIAVKHARDTKGRVPLTGLTPGQHRIQLGDLAKVITVQ